MENSRKLKNFTKFVVNDMLKSEVNPKILSPLEINLVITWYLFSMHFQADFNSPYYDVSSKAFDLQMREFGYSLEELAEKFSFMKATITDFINQTIQKTVSDNLDKGQETNEEDITEAEIETLESLISYRPIFIVELFKDLLIKKIITSKSPNYQEIARTIRFSTPLATLLTNQSLNKQYRAIILESELNEEEITKNLNFITRYEFIEKNLSVLRQPNGILVNTQRFLQIYDLLKIGTSEEKDYAEHYLCESISHLSKLVITEREDQMISVSMRDNNLPSSSFNDADLCEFAEAVVKK